MPTRAPRTALPPRVTQREVEQVIEALESPQYNWRTIGGIAEETGISTQTVRRVIEYLQEDGVVIRSSVNAEDGSELFTTRLNWRKKASLWNRFIAALRNRVE